MRSHCIQKKLMNYHFIAFIEIFKLLRTKKKFKRNLKVLQEHQIYFPIPFLLYIKKNSFHLYNILMGENK